MVEGATLEMWCTARYRGFESLSLRHFYAPFSKTTVKIINLKIASKLALEIFHFYFITSCWRRKCDFFEGCPALLDLSVCDARARFGLRPRVESLSLRHFFFLQKMANEAARLLFTVPSGTARQKPELSD